MYPPIGIRTPSEIVKRLSNQLVVACVRQHPEIAVLLLDAERPLQLARLEAVVVVGRVLEARLVAVFPDQTAVLRARAEARECVVAPEVLAAQEADLGIEVVLDNQTIDLQPVAIGVVVDLPAVAQVIAVHAGRP